MQSREPTGSSTRKFDFDQTRDQQRDLPLEFIRHTLGHTYEIQTVIIRISDSQYLVMNIILPTHR